MAQSDREIKIIPARSISRENHSRDVRQEPPVIAPKKIEEEPQKVNRRRLFQTLIPATGKALTDFFRNVNTRKSD